jgi:hypothetical protein
VIVAVDERHPHAVELQLAELAVAHLARLAYRGRELLVIDVAIAEHKVRRPLSEQLNYLRRTDVAAMQHGFDLKAFEHPHGLARARDMAVRVADDAESHANS